MADNIGSFGAAIGGGSALAEAMQRRGIDISTLQQQSPASAGGGVPIPQDPSQVQAAQAAIPQGTPAPQGTTQPKPEPTDPELMVAMEALGGFVKSAGSTRRDLAKARVGGLV